MSITDAFLLGMLVGGIVTGVAAIRWHLRRVDQLSAEFRRIFHEE